MHNNNEQVMTEPANTPCVIPTAPSVAVSPTASLKMQIMMMMKMKKKKLLIPIYFVTCTYNQERLA
jgi:hypothetical protein